MIVQLKNLAKIYPSGGESLEIFKEVDLEIEEGSLVTITGESGCGKSTLLNLIGGLDSCSRGEILACGYRIDLLRESEMTDYRNRCLGMIFQFHFLLEDFSAVENVMMPALIAGVSRKTAEEKALDLLGEIGLAERRGHFPSQLSGGERQRVATVRALMNDPQLILADEPTGNLDERNSRMVEDQLFRLVADHGKTLLMVTHDSICASRGNRRLHLHEGRLCEN